MNKVFVLTASGTVPQAILTLPCPPVPYPVQPSAVIGEAIRDEKLKYFNVEKNI